MIRLFQRLLLFSGLQKKRLIRSFLAYLVSSFFEMIPIMAILTVLTGILIDFLTFGNINRIDSIAIHK